MASCREEHIHFFKISNLSARVCFGAASRSSSCLSIANAPFGPLPASVLARRTQYRRVAYVSFKSLTPCPLLRTPTWRRRTVSALKAEVNERSVRLSDFFDLSSGGSLRALSLIEVSTESGAAQESIESLRSTSENNISELK